LKDVTNQHEKKRKLAGLAHVRHGLRKHVRAREASHAHGW